jgi:hypothetical protein
MSERRAPPALLVALPCALALPQRRAMLGWRGNRTRAIIPVGCAPFSAGGRYAGTSQSVSQVPRSFSYKTSKCADQPHQLVHHRPFEKPADHASFKSSQVKFIQSRQKKFNANLKYMKGNTSYTFTMSSRHTTRKQHLFTAEAFHLPARPVLREYSYRVLCSRHRCYATTISEYGIASRRPDPKHDRNPAADRAGPSSERQQSTFAPTHTRTSARPS